eukprot:TRINITY_DN7465_c0_g2_i3.p1 TRINITY_DN7465_c0_g2~~TRINITY_DN7465_c0_g2_i3.p1  ORF type:complete len:197 (+),score=29.15 TRINITY_DN7465_c0_g2_i3:73-663(+)
MCIRDSSQHMNKIICIRYNTDMRYLVGIMALVISQAVCGTANGTVTCWDVCAANCQRQNGWLENGCMKACGCSCEADCLALCDRFQLGSLCKFKCGCFQDYTFKQNGSFFIIPVEKLEDLEGSHNGHAEKTGNQTQANSTGQSQALLQTDACVKNCTETCTRISGGVISTLVACMQQCNCTQTTEQLMKGNRPATS